MQPGKEFLNFSFIALGAATVAFGVVGFLSPNHIATGGTAGLAIVLDHIVPLSVGIWMVVINVPLLLLGVRYLGRAFAVKTIACIAMIAGFIELFSFVVKLEAMSENLMLATLYGGVCVGVGLGLVFKGGASAGGGTILARIFATRTNVKSGTIILVLDGVVVSSAALVFKSVELGLWSLISIYATSRLIDAVLVGGQSQKIVHISSTRNLRELSAIISEKMHISGTIVTGDNIASSEHKDIIFLMVEKSRLNTLKQLVQSYDADVKMIVMEATEVLGREKARM